METLVFSQDISLQHTVVLVFMNDDEDDNTPTA